MFSWIPAYLALPVAAGGRGLSIAASSEWIVIMQVGMWLGYVTFGYVSDAVGRRITYVTYLLVATVLVPLYAEERDPRMLLVLGPLLAFFAPDISPGLASLARNFSQLHFAPPPWDILITLAAG